MDGAGLDSRSLRHTRNRGPAAFVLGVNKGGWKCVGRARVDGWTDGWMDGRTDGRTDGRQPMRRVLLTTCGGDHLVQEFGAGAFPDLLDDRAQLLVGLVDVALRLDLQRGSNQGKQRGVEHHRAVAVQGHVHAHQALKHTPGKGQHCKTSITGQSCLRRPMKCHGPHQEFNN